MLLVSYQCDVCRSVTAEPFMFRDPKQVMEVPAEWGVLRTQELNERTGNVLCVVKHLCPECLPRRS